MNTAPTASPSSSSGGRTSHHPDPRWPAVVARDASADGTFVYSVRTTGVYCRPSCAARLARPENVAFHPTCGDAERAGFRPCLRCKPKEAPPAERTAARIAEVCRAIEASDEPVNLEALAERAGLSVSHFHRTFRAVTGLTPREYAASRRAERVRAELARGRSVTGAMYEAGYQSSGRFYAESDAILGMTPTSYKRGAPDEEIRFAVGESSLGAILVAATARGVCAISLGNDPDGLVRELERRFPRARLLGGDAAFERLVATVIGLVERPNHSVDLPLDIRGTVFQERVWQALRAIPPGTTTTYSEIAARLGTPRAVRAVAGACAANVLAVAIPCHRVVRHGGGLSGYRWGVERKQALLQRERSASSS